ncbi:DUF1566 domain-containing protein [Legionella pneumophila serogroup 1]|uniref:Lcl domain-containing protein n=1 Tax=Legionella pneumophila TaxID=446 RepID=UPI00077095AE|nr:DUF1566 domain-containing protein [Legionella pneumophila]MCZ4749122.1 DUF1566 domain-containing protein [Legionella pneumophila]CZO94748.1 Uncharacterised protein [Legionella pneumophila]CZP74800.1 Uncharacterised protein [Legionella pneumophila]HAT6350012.1 DUF1566 domain-containing protein [Legionella pneumophila]HAT7970941.1 DUF1566 domain-containing protein [Legionella pneumophila]
MQRKKRHFFRNIILTAFFSCLMLPSVQASKPLWTFVPQTPTDITVVKGSGAQVIYTVNNQSSRPKTLVMKLIAGISQSAPCQLPAKGSCTLTLNVNGATLQGDVVGGPVLCQQGNDLQCYQPSSTNILRIRLIEQPPVQQFTVTPSAGANGSISPATAQVVNAGSSLTFTATPNTGFGVNQWLLDGNVVQNGGTTFQLSNIQANHTVGVTFNQTTLSPLTQNLALSINSPGADPALSGNARIIRIKNTGSIPANNVQVSTSGFPAGTSITNNDCTGTLNAGATCDITITPGGTASPDNSANACTTSPGTEPEPTIVTVSADNAPSTNVNVLVLGYGCIYQGGFLFSVDDSTLNTGSIGGKVAALTDEEESPGDFSFQWATVFDDTTADSITDGFTNTNALETPEGQYPAAQACLNKSSQGFTDWFMPAICELGRFVGVGSDAGCGNTNPNLYTTLYKNNLGGFANVGYWSSSEYSGNPTVFAWFQYFNSGVQLDDRKNLNFRVRCVRAFTP